MSSTDDFEAEASRRDYRAPYSHNHPIPTIQRYREHKSELDGQREAAEEAQHTEEDDSRVKRAAGAVKKIWKDEDTQHAKGDAYPTRNRYQRDGGEPGKYDSGLPSAPDGADGSKGEEADNRFSKQNGSDGKDGKDDNKANGSSATEKAAGHQDPKQKRKDMKHNKRDDGGREVTDPVTHLPLVIRDSTAKDLKRAPENKPAPGFLKSPGTGLSGHEKSESDLEDEKKQLQDGFEGVKKVFPPPEYEDVKVELGRVYAEAVLAGVGGLGVVVVLVPAIFWVFGSRSQRSDGGGWIGKEKRGSTVGLFISLPIALAIISGLGFGIITFVKGWLDRRVQSIFEDDIWTAARAEEQRANDQENQLPESVSWMNSLLSSVWPLINPDLFASIIDMLEDVMQASLPKVIRMVSVDDLGQGSESIRILGIRWLPTGAADRSVDENGNLRGPSGKETNDRAAPGQGEEEKLEDNAEGGDETIDQKKKEQEKKETEKEKEAMREGMEAEQGDFVNMELAFAYRARSSGKSIKSKAKNAHLYLKFYLPGGIFIPVWVELRGIIGTMRLRLQLTPDPPFFSLCTLTFLGQPKADISCVPLMRKMPNLMDVPFISGFVQSAIDAALAEYVAPKSLTLDLKDMLVGDDFKKDTVARGVLVIFIKEAQGFKEGDGSIGPMQGSSDSYISCSWGKFGKTVSSTRVIEKDQNPKWHEWAYMLVGPEELNAEEKLRLQLWDSDKFTADDDLGRVEVDLKHLMHSPKTKNKMCDREDRFRAQDPEEKMPGTLTWSVGYYEKIRITPLQLSQQTEEKDIRSKESLKTSVSEAAERKLREATAHDESREINQQKAQDYRERENALICASPPDPDFPSGILSIQIHNITGLEVEALQKDKNDDADREDETEESDDLPSSYCTIILNHKKIYMTRTKPKNGKPFFNAGTERFVRDWQTAEVMVSVRDNRERENDALLGIVYLPLKKVFEKRSQVMDTYPLVGGIGFGRARISLVWRSVEMNLDKELLGWDLGTLEIKSPIKISSNLPSDLQGAKITCRSNIMRGKFAPKGNGGEWYPKHRGPSSGDADESIFLACKNRYRMPLFLEFRSSSGAKLGMGKSTSAFGVFWLSDIPDEEERTVQIKIWKAGKEEIKKATTCAGYDGLEEGEEALGELEVRMCFWRGLGGYHKGWAKKGGNEDVRNVVEVLDTVNDEIGDASDESEDGSDSDSDSDTDSDFQDGMGQTVQTKDAQTTKQKLKTHTNQKDSDSSEEEGGDENTKNPLKMLKNKLNEGNDSEDGERGVMGQMRDYNKHKGQLHRKHRGIMQWKAMRNAEWAVGKVKGVGRKVEGLARHSEKGGAGVETEV